MRLSQAIKPISYLKAHASELIREIADEHKTLIITQNGQAKAIVQDLESYEQMQESLALLKMIAQSRQCISQGQVKTVRQSFKQLRSRIRESQ